MLMHICLFQGPTGVSGPKGARGAQGAPVSYCFNHSINVLKNLMVVFI